MQDKIKKIYVCSACGTTYPKWEGKCQACHAWNTIVEELTSQSKNRKQRLLNPDTPIPSRFPMPIHQIETTSSWRISTGIKELDRVLGGGIVPGSITLLGGYPGIGKSTLLLQMALKENLKVLYVSGEESESQIKMRVDRIQKTNPLCYLYNENSLELILSQVDQLKPDLLIIDSIQTMAHPLLDSTPGSISQIRECTGELQRYAKQHNLPIFIVGHINKEGDLAGPKLLEHIVDTVLQLEGDQNNLYRLLRTKKNRFGSTDELGIFEMNSSGLREVENPSELLINQTDETLSGSAIACTLEGSRPLLIEIQALVSTAIYGIAQRSATGYDNRRLNMLLAVLEKRAGIFYGQKDVFMNITGGIRIDDPAADLAVAAALVSSYHDIPLSALACFSGEIGLSGEIRAVPKIDQRIQEAARLGYKDIYLSSYNSKKTTLKNQHIRIHPIPNIRHFIQCLLDR